MSDDLLNQGDEGGEELLRKEREVKPGSSTTAVETPTAETPDADSFGEFENLKEGLEKPLTELAGKVDKKWVADQAAKRAVWAPDNLTNSPTVNVPGFGSTQKKADLPHQVTGFVPTATTPAGMPEILRGGSSQVQLVDYHPENAPPGVTVKIADPNLTNYSQIVDTACKLVGTIETCSRLLSTVADPLTKKQTKMETLSLADLGADAWKETIKNLAQALKSDNANVLTTLFQKDLLKVGKNNTPLKDVGVIEVMKQLAVSGRVNEAMQLAERIGVTGAMQLAAATGRVQTTLKKCSDDIQKILREPITQSQSAIDEIKKVRDQFKLSYGEKEATTTTSLLPPTKERKIK